MLTRKQSRLLRLIEEWIEEHGVAPSYDEVRDTLGLASKSSVHRMMLSLGERGYIRRLPNKARAVEVLRSHRPPRWGDGVEVVAPPRVATGELPLLGHVAAGSPVVVWEATAYRYVGVPSTFLRPGSDYYALEIRGDSMEGAGIRNGDIGVIRRQETANERDIVVALVDGEEATLKRFHSQSNEIELRAENPDYDDIKVSPDRVQIQGRLTGLLRSYD